jgi:hypothetical protein
MTQPLGLSDTQLGLLFAAASLIKQHDRHAFLAAFADQLSNNKQADDLTTALALASALLEGSDMQIQEVVHRLRIRANTADECGERYLAIDIRTAIQTITQMDDAAKSANKMSATNGNGDPYYKANRFFGDRRELTTNKSVAKECASHLTKRHLLIARVLPTTPGRIGERRTACQG